MGDDVSTDEILPAGAKVLPYRSNIQKIEGFAFERIDSTYVERARAVRATTGHAVVAGRNYGQGASPTRTVFGLGRQKACCAA